MSVAGLALLLALPASNIPLFSGLPLSGAAEAIGFLLVAPLLVSRSVRGALMRTAGKFAARPYAVTGCGLLALAFLAKLALSLSGTPIGWHACYRAVDAPVTGGECERSFENLWFSESATRFDQKLDFGPMTGGEPARDGAPWNLTYLSSFPGIATSDWDLGFFNSLRWNRLEPLGYRYYLPFEVRWSAQVIGTSDQEVAVSYLGEGSISYGGATRDLPPAYDSERTVRIEGTADKGNATVRFAYRPPGSVDENYGPHAVLRVEGLQARDPTTLERLLAWSVDVPIILLLGALALGYAGLARGLWWGWIPATAVALALVVPSGDPQALATRAALAVIAILAVVVWRPSLRALLFGPFAVVLVNVIRVAHEFPSWHSVIYRQAGGDFLGYESFARDILETGSLQGGEDVFISQPAIRYLLFGLRALFGDGDAILAVSSRSLISIGIIFAIGVVCVFLVRRAIHRLLCLAAGACVLVVVNANTDLGFFVDASLSEWPTWAGIPIGVAMLVLAPTRRWLLIGTGVIALCTITRTNMAPALITIVGIGLVRWWPSDRRWVLLCACVFAAIASLPLLHNLYYGGSAVVSTTSGPANVVLPLPDILDALSDSDVRAVLERQVRLLLYASPEALSEGTRISLRLLQVGYLVALIWVLARWRRTDWTLIALIVTPLLMLLPFIVYDADTNYPRHIVAGHILMAVVMVVALGLEASKSRAWRQHDAGG